MCLKCEANLKENWALPNISTWDSFTLGCPRLEEHPVLFLGSSSFHFTGPAGLTLKPHPPRKGCAALKA